MCKVRVTETESRYQCDTSTGLRLTESEVGTVIDQLNNGKAPDEYGFSSEHFKAAKPVIVPLLTDLFNQILAEKKVPTFKTRIITPVLKKGKTQNVWKIIGESTYHQHSESCLNIQY